MTLLAAGFTPSDISVSDYLDYWYDNYVKTNLSYNTQKDYEKENPCASKTGIRKIPAGIIGDRYYPKMD